MRERVRLRTVMIGVGVVAVLIAVGVGLLLRHRDAPSTTASSVPDGLQVSFVPATGVRTGAPTVVTGAVINTGSIPRPASFTVSDLPAGTSLSTVLPSPTTPAGGAWWSCTGATCTWTGPDGGAATIAPNDGVELLLAFTGAPTTPDAGLTVTLDGLAPASVSLQLPDGAAPLAADAISLSLTGGSTVLIGTPGSSTAKVTNFASSPIAPGALSVQFTPPDVPGLITVASGDGWRCTASVCTNTVALAPLAVSTPITLAQSAPAGTAPGSGALSAVASVAAPSMQASASLPVTVRPNRSWTVGTRVFLDRGSIVEGSVLMATIEVVATGQGSLTDVVDLSLDPPTGFTVDWSSATPDGPFACSANGCTSNGPLTAGAQYLVDVPVTVPVGARPGTGSIAVGATVAGADGTVPQTSSSTSFTVVPAPAASLRARLSGLDGPDPRGGAIGFSPGASRELQVTVTNEGAAPYRAGNTVYVTATPSTTETVVATGGDGWTCIPGTTGEVSPRWPLRCHLILTADLAPSATLTLPFSLAPDGGSVSDWTVGVGTTMRTANLNATHARVEVQAHAPRLGVAIVEEQPIHDGGAGELVVRMTNLGDRTAAGGVVVVTVPSDADLLSWAGPSWSCVDATLSGSDGVVTCSTSSVIAPGAVGPSLFLSVGVNGHPSSVEFSAWASAVGQYDVAGVAPVTATFEVASAVEIDAGPELTVATPVLGANGIVAPAVVTLTGSAGLVAAKNLQWTQLCVQAGSPDCGATVSPVVTWSGVPAGALPTTATAQFTAPSGITAPVDLFFRLSGIVGTSAISDDVVVHLVPSTFAVPADGAGSTSGTPGGAPTIATGVPQPGPPPSPPPPTATIAGSGAPVQVPTRAAGQLVGGGSGVGALQYSWAQTSGPDATIIGSTATQPILSFTSPTLAPDQQSDTLVFELTVTDATGATATAEVTVDVVWGDDGLQAVLAGGAPNVVASIDGPVTISSTVTSRGAPYTYAWSVDGFDLPSDTATDSPSLAFTAGDAAADGSATLEVTDSFGRVTTVSIPVIVSALPPGQVPVAFCDAVAALQAGRSASLAGVGVQVIVPAGTVSTATCAADTVVSFTTASATLPGGVSLSGATGQLTIAGASFTTASVSVPANWSLGGAEIGSNGLLAPFVSTSAIGVPTGGLTSASTPFVAPTGWTGSTLVTFTASPQPAAVLIGTSVGTTAGQALQLTATSIGGAVTAQVSGTGLIGIGPVDVPVSGTVSTTSSTATPVLDVSAVLDSPVALGAGVAVGPARLAWTPSQATGDVVVTIGAGSNALTLDSSATTVSSSGVTFDFPGSATVWSSAPGAPTVTLSGTGSLQGGQLQLALTSSAVPDWSIAAQLALTNLQVSVAVDCPLSTSDTCGPSVEVGANATGPQFAAPFAVAGSLDPSTGVVSLTGSAGTVTVAPLSVSGATLTVQIGPAVAPGAVASGSATVLGASVPVTVVFGDTATTAAARLGTVTIAAGWSIPDVIAFATTSSTTYSATVAAAGGAAVSVPLPAGVLIGVGITQLPSTLASSVLPDDLQSGLVSFTIGTGPVTAYTIAVPVPTPWYVAGEAGTDAALQVTSMTFSVTTGPAGASVAVSGTGVVTAAPTAIGTVVNTLPMPFTGQLTPGLLGMTFTSTASPWVSAFGAPGFVASGLSVSVRIEPSQTTATLTGAMALPPALAANIGTGSTGTAPTFSADLAAGPLCVGIDLAPAGGVDIGGYGFLEAAGGYVALASAPCQVAATAVPAGISVVVDGSTLGTLVLPVAPDSFALSGSASPSTEVYVGGLGLDPATVTIGPGTVTDTGRPTVTISGSTTIGTQDLAVSGSIAAQPDGTWAVQFAPAVDSLTLDWATMSSPEVTITCLAVLTTQSGASEVSVQGVLPVVSSSSTASAGSSPPPLSAGLRVDLAGTIVGGTVTSLTQTLAPTTYALFGVDTMTVPLTVNYTTSPSASLTVASPVTMDVLATVAPLSITEAPGAVRTYQISSLSVAPDGTLSITAATPYLTEGMAGQMSTTGVVTGTYTLGTGDYSFTAASLPGTLAGLAAPTDLTVSRASGTVTATQTSSLTPGIFDTDVTIEVTGMLGVLGAGPVVATSTVNTLTGSANGLTLRGLTGDASFSVAPASASQQPLTGYTAFIDSVTFATDPGGCVFWTENPTLQGVVYGSGGTTYYTLAGTTPTVLSVPGIPFLSASDRQQPVVISNEVVPGSPPATDGLTLAYPFSAAAFSGFGQVSLDFATCAFSVGGTAVMQFGALGPAGQALDQALTGPTGLQIQAGSLFSPSGELPPSIAVVRVLLQAESVSAQLAAQAAQQQSIAQAAQREVATYNSLAQGVAQDVEVATQRVQQAQQAVNAAVSNYIDAYAAAAGDLEAAQDNLTALKNSAVDAQNSLSTAQASLDAANERVGLIQDAATTALSDAAAANSAAEDFQEKSAQTAHPTLLQLTLDITWCKTCQVTFALSIDGQFSFAGPWVVEFGFSLQYGSSGQTAEIDFGGGIEEQKQVSAGPVGAAVNAELLVDANVGLAFDQFGNIDQITDVSATVQASASIDVWVSIWCCTWSAQLASIEGQGSLQIVPTPVEDSFAFEVQIGPFSKDLEYGPAQL